MGILGDVIREVKDTVKFALDEGGFEDLKNEVKDLLRALKEKSL